MSRHGSRAWLADVVELGDLDELVRTVDRLCDERDWDGLVELRDRCRRALERGKQLWPAASLAEYRLALDAPGPWAAATLVEGAGRFALGPLPEVAASTHRWDELAPHAPAGPAAALAAHERVVRGEDLADDERVDPHVLDLPLRLEAWEPAYPTATYRPDGADFPSPVLPRLEPADLPDTAHGLDDAATEALLELVRPWVAESNGRADAVCAAGTAEHAIARLGVRRARTAEVGADEALALMVWAGASGGAYGRRRGAAVGRFNAWWAAAQLLSLDTDGPVDPDELGELGETIGELRWVTWDAFEPAIGWSLHLAVEDPGEGRSWAITASDTA